MSTGKSIGEEVEQLREDMDRVTRERAQDRGRVATIEERLDDLEARIDALEERAPSPGKKEYDEMDKSDKVTVLRSKLKQEAQATNGNAAVTYKDVVRMFDGHPSPGHAYDLMEAAATEEGYNYTSNPEGQKRLTYRVNG